MSPQLARSVPCSTPVVLWGVRLRRLEPLLVALLPALVTLPRFWNGFVFDDVFVIERGTFIHDLSNLPRAFTSHTMVASSLDAAVGRPAMDTYRPLPLVSFLFEAAISGRSPWAYHLAGTLLHGLVCLLFHRLLRGLLGAESKLPLLIALCFGLAPWLAEAHVFINGRSDPLLALFVLLALLLQRRSLARSSMRDSMLAGLFALGALLSKEVAVFALPFIALVPSVGAASWRTRAVRAVPLLAALAIYLGLRAAALDGLRTNSGPSQVGRALFNLPLLLVDGLFHVLLPSPFALRNLRDDYQSLPTILSPLAALGLLVLFGLLARHAKGGSAVVLWGAAFGLATLAPAMMITTELWPGFGRYLYLPAIGLFTAVASLLAPLERRAGRERPLLIGLIAVAAFAAGCLLDATLALRSEEVLYTRAIARAPGQAWPIGSLGLAVKRRGRCDEAAPLLAMAAGMAPSESRYAVHFGRCLVELGDYAEALRVAERGRAQFRGTRVESAFLVIEVLARRDPQAAAPLLARCLELDPKRTDCAELQQQNRRYLDQQGGALPRP